MHSGRARGDIDVGADTCLEAARQGDGNALGVLLEGFRTRLGRLAKRQLGARLRANVSHSDVVQETFAEACVSIRTFRGRNLTQLEAWLLGILGHRLANLKRHYERTEKRGSRKQVSFGVDSAAARWLEGLPGHTTPASERARRRERGQALGEAIAQLPESYQQILAWRLQDDLTFEQIGKLLEKSPDAVRQTYVRALKQLKSILGPGHDPS